MIELKILPTYTRPKAPNKNLICIHIEIAQLVGGLVLWSWICDQMKKVVSARNTFHLTHV